ncbi:TrkA C-terminal domain-containing protein [Clostridium sp.]|uniref:TrkA C-terminal domain-containing protein n=1 Tax=Clostridium sp. TaxID=1506 RepID=UPI0026082D49|nr:TrkA C-terminal domain-containing protein [Clostridium sp.]
MINSTIPTYKKIALDIANKIRQGSIEEGAILYGRSSLASKYNVSPETIRRAIMLLEDLEVVKSFKGKGILVVSKKQAVLFLDRNSSIDNMKDYKLQINTLMDERKKIDDQILSSINVIIDYSSRFDELNTIIPIEFKIPEDCIYIGKSIAEIKLWQNTGATLIAIKRDDKMFLSPGPYIIINSEDIFIVVGNDEIKNSVPDFLFAK